MDELERIIKIAQHTTVPEGEDPIRWAAHLHTCLQKRDDSDQYGLDAVQHEATTQDKIRTWAKAKGESK